MKTINIMIQHWSFHSVYASSTTLQSKNLRITTTTTTTKWWGIRTSKWRRQRRIHVEMRGRPTYTMTRSHSEHTGFSCVSLVAGRALVSCLTEGCGGTGVLGRGDVALPPTA